MNYKKLVASALCIPLLLSGCNSSKKLTAVTNDYYRTNYEIFVYSYYDSDGDGIGDLNGIIEKLDYLNDGNDKTDSDLGVNGIWLTPICPSTTYHKYDVTDYMAIDLQYGSMEDFESLIATAHDKHINVITDMVINHTSSKHPWFIEATGYLKGLSATDEPNSADCPYVNFYHFSKERKDNTWYQIEGTEYYYEGSFWSEMPDLNLSDATLMAELKDIMAFWIDKGVDGFRMDAPLHYEETDTEFNTGVLKKLYDYCKGIKPDIYMVSEVWASEQTIEDYYTSLTPSMFDFDFAQGEGDIIMTAWGRETAKTFVERMIDNDAARRANNPDYINASFITNHDMSRIYNAYNGKQDKMKMAAILLLSMPGSPYIYYGEEIGMMSYGPKDENKRLPMYWSDKTTEGMCSGPDDADKDIMQKCKPADKQFKDKNSLYNTYKKGLELRNNNPEIARGSDVILSDMNSDNTVIIARTWEDEVVFIIYNTSYESVRVPRDAINSYMSAKGLSYNNEVIGTMSVGGKDAKAGEEEITVPACSVTYLK